MNVNHSGFYKCVLAWVICIEGLVCLGWWEMAVAVFAAPLSLFVTAYAIGIVCLAGVTGKCDHGEWQ